MTLLDALSSALEHSRSGRTREAERIYRDVVREGAAAQAAGPDALLLLGRLARRLGHAREAAGFLQRSLALADPPDAALLREVGELLCDARRFGEATGFLARAVARDPADAGHWLALIDALHEQGRFEEAEQTARTALAAHAGNARLWAALALALIGARRFGAGTAAAARALEHDPGCLPALRAVALAALQDGRRDEAERACTEALARQPDHPETTALLAVVRLLQGRSGEAEALFRAALHAKPALAETWSNYATLLARTGRPREAEDAAAQAVALKPFLSAAHHLLGTLRRDAGDAAGAAAAFRRALAGDPTHGNAGAGLADALRHAGRNGDAEAVCRRGLTATPGDAGLLVALGATLQAQGRHGAALEAYAEALARRPDLPEAHNNIACIHEEEGRLDDAVAELRRALAIRPQAPEILASLAAVLLRLNRQDEAEAALLEAARLGPSGAPTEFRLGRLHLRTGRRDRALPHIRRAVRQDPGNSRHWAALGQALRGVRFADVDGPLRDDLLGALAHGAVEKTHIAEATASAVLLGEAMAGLHRTLESDDAGTVVRRLRAGDLDGLAGDALLRALLESAIITDPGLERALTALRRAMLDAVSDGAPDCPGAAWLPLCCALAQQCFANEYVFAQTAGEAELAAALGAALSGALDRGEAVSPIGLAVLAAYRPLHRWEGVQRLLAAAPAAGWPDGFAALLDRLVAEPLEEEALRPAIPALTPIEDAVSRAVRLQYEENPHPRWFTAGLVDAPLPVPEMVRALLPHVRLAPADWSAPDVLVAGCGTGREAVWAANHLKGARVLAVDLSRASLAHALHRTRRLGIDGVAYGQADILRLGELGRRFDIVQSVGVLHHMDDPMAGWRVLTGLLRPHGLMKIGLYSETARPAVVRARALIAERGLLPTPEGIRRFRAEVMALPGDDPLKGLVQSADFYNTSACRDLLFHVQEHRTTLPAVAAALDELGLEFLGFQLDDPGSAQLYRARFPGDPDMTDLALWARFEEEHPLTFAGLYQFWVRKRG